MKISSLELGYTIPESITKKVKISRFRIYAAMDNVCTFTSYPYFDPEVGSMSGNILDTGLDFGMYPQARTTRFGVNLIF